MLASPDVYSRNSSMQARDANKLLDRLLPRMSFEEDDIIMDIGCGTGENTKHVLLPRIPKFQKIIGVDINSNMLHFARANAAGEKVEFHLADIEDRSSVSIWEGSISKIFSTHCIHWLKNQRRGFESLYSLLKPKGEAGLLFLLSTPTWNSYPVLINNVKWNTYLKNVDQYVPESHHLKLRSDFFQEMLRELGFEVLICEEANTSYSYKDDNEARESWSTTSALPPHIPQELREEFLDELFEGYMNFNPRNSHGLPTAYFTILIVHIRKP